MVFGHYANKTPPLEVWTLVFITVFFPHLKSFLFFSNVHTQITCVLFLERMSVSVFRS